MSQLNVFMGRDLDANHESYHFIRLNNWILSKYNGSWDRPPSVSAIREISPTRNQIVSRLTAATSGKQMIRYFGPSKYYQYKMESFSGPWGWKDPRNTFTSWLWDEIFPDASYIYIVRCGVDVAQSLIKREHQTYRDYRLVERIQNIKQLFFDILTIKRSFSKFPPDFRNLRQKASAGCANLEDAFGLWETYLQGALEFLQNKIDKNRLLEINYEKLLEQPTSYINMLADISSAKISTEQVENIISKIDASRRFPFTKEPHLLKFYENVRQSPLMRYYNYDNIH
jgi:hypothetical protein